VPREAKLYFASAGVVEMSELRQIVSRGYSLPKRRAPTGTRAATPKKTPASSKGRRSAGAVTRLRRELAATKGRLSAALLDLSTTREELQSSNEELQSSNEELQSSNEELQSSNEELQSSNEELALVNAQLVEKMAEVTRSSDDVANLLKSSDIATLLLDPELRVSRFTPAASSVFALHETDIGRPLAELRMLVKYTGFFDDAKAVAAGAPPVENRVADGRGQVLIARLTPYRTRDGHTQGVVATFVNVTSLERARTALRENAEQLRALFDHVAVGIAVTDTHGGLIEVNPALCRMLALERDDLVGRPLSRHVHPDGGRIQRQLNDELIAGRRTHYDIEDRYLRADGSELWARVSVSLIQPGGGTPARAVHVIQDVSEVKRSEKQLRAQEGIARLGEMAAAIAHEVRSPLAAILGAVDILATRLPSGVEEQHVVQEIRQRIASVDALVGELLQFARPKDIGFTRIPLLRLLQDTAGLLKGSGELGEVEFEISGEEVEVLGDVELLKSVFVNLASNAAQAMNGRGKLRVEIRNERNSCTIVFNDNGPGVPEALAHKIFEPFFTTRSRGIGLGLALAKRIVEAHGGEIALLPSVDPGTKMIVTLPRVSGPLSLEEGTVPPMRPNRPN
jgi:two-component system CheB/CheR fusion protein